MKGNEHMYSSPLLWYIFPPCCSYSPQFAGICVHHGLRRCCRFHLPPPFREIGNHIRCTLIFIYIVKAQDSLTLAVIVLNQVYLLHRTIVVFRQWVSESREHFGVESVYNVDCEQKINPISGYRCRDGSGKCRGQN